MANKQILFLRSKRNATPRWLYQEHDILKLAQSRADGDTYTEAGLPAIRAAVRKIWTAQQRADWVRIVDVGVSDAAIAARIAKWQAKADKVKCLFCDTLVDKNTTLRREDNEYDCHPCCEPCFDKNT